ncbi:hypothetical protein [Persicobacter psychrovividus]|uniref:hypothetical protein n=1 Tax=Persicobacter psychrovividus TaxID=387638 RepID=UPI0030CA30A3
METKIRYQGDIKNSQLCSYIDADGKENTASPYEIKGYTFKDGKFYVSKNFIKQEMVEKVFVEYLVKGQKGLYFLRDWEDFHYLIDCNDSSVMALPFQNEMISQQGKSYQRKSTKYIGILKNYFVDCPDLYKEIEGMRKPNEKQLTHLTKKYNDKVCGEGTCIVFEKKKAKFIMAIEPYFASTHFKGLGNYAEQGGLLYFWLPKSNERIYLKTGLLFSSQQNQQSLYRIPLRFEYVYSSKFIQPKFDLGLNIFSLRNPEYQEGMGVSFAGSTGLRLRLSKFAFIDLSLETDFMTLAFDTDLFPSYSLGTGLLILF